MSIEYYECLGTDHPLLIMHLKNYGTPRLVNSAKLTDVTPTVRSEGSKSSI
jgi:hypothetical protein